jgi:hypothetical protein
MLALWHRISSVPALAGIGIAVAWALLAAAPASGGPSCTRYAAPTGLDTAEGTEAAPFRSAQKLVDSLGAGETGCLRAGEYSQPGLRFGAAGTAEQPITLRSYPGERARISGGYVFVPHGADFVTISGLTIDGADHGAPTIQVMAADTVIEDNLITNRNRGESCVILGSLAGYGRAERTLVRRNRLADCGNPANGIHDHGIYVENTEGVKIVDNVFWNAAAWAVHLYPSAHGTLVAHNVVDDSGGGVIIAGEGGGAEYVEGLASSDTVVEYNVISDTTGQYAIESHWGGPVGTGNVARFNCLFNGAKGNVDTSDGGFTAADNVEADPLYLDAGARDYRLRTGSPCLSVVGYDAAAKVLEAQEGLGPTSPTSPADPASTTPEPTPAPTPSPSPAPTPSPSPTPTAGATGEQPPSLLLTAPSAGSTFGSYLCPRATAGDDDRIVRVRFYLDDALMLDDDSPEYGSCFSTLSVSDGGHTLSARAFDTDGGTASASVTIFRGQAASGAPLGSRPPELQLTAPAGGSSFGSYVCPKATASDDDAVTRVRFHLDGVLMVDDDSPEYGSCFSTASVAPGEHTLSASAFDRDGGAASVSIAVIRTGP